MNPNEVEVSNATDGDGQTVGILVRFPDEATMYDSPAEARGAADRIEQTLADEDVDDPAAEAFIADIRNRADEWEQEVDDAAE